MVYLLFVCVVPLPCSRFHSLFLAWTDVFFSAAQPLL
jgi:hypothetical protein